MCIQAIWPKGSAAEYKVAIASNMRPTGKKSITCTIFLVVGVPSKMSSACSGTGVFLLNTYRPNKKKDTATSKQWDKKLYSAGVKPLSDK